MIRKGMQLYGTGRMIKGASSWTEGSLYIYPSFRNSTSPRIRLFGGGFRFVIDVKKIADIKERR